MSDGSGLVISFVQEDTFGVVKTDSNLQKIHHTSEGLGQNSSIQEGNSVRGDRQTKDVKRTKVSASGPIAHELRYGEYDAWLAAALMSAGWSAPVVVTASTISFAVSSGGTQVITDSLDGFGSLVSGQYVQIKDATNAANNGYFKISAQAIGEITVSNASGVLETAGASVTITMGAQVVNGTQLVSYNIEKDFTDLTNELALLTGMCVNQMSLNIALDSIITGSFDFMGKDETSQTTSQATGYDDLSSNDVFSVADVLSVLEGGSSYDTNQLSFSLQNNLRDRLNVGSVNTVSFGKGKIAITGTHQAYYATKAIMDKALNFTSSSLLQIAVDADGNAYLIEFPNIKYGDGKRVGGGQDTDIIADMPFTAYMDETEEITVRIVRFPAA